MAMLFYSWQEREAKATKEWCNHRGSYPRKYTYFTFEDGSKKKIKGNVDNAPTSFRDCMYSDESLKEFIDYGNENEWNRPYKELEEWYYITMPEESDEHPRGLL